MLNDYEQVQPIGKGSFSKVYKAVNKYTKKPVAIKVIPIKLFNRYKERILAELDIIRKLKHVNILEFFEIYQSRNNIYVLSELCDGTLTKIISIITTEQQIFDIYAQIINGIKYLYDHKIFHRDIKPENILIKNDIIKIADFGFAKETEDYNKISDTICGSPLYMAPEIVLEKPYSIKSDIWSLGIILYQMMYKTHPYGEVKTIIQLVNNFNIKTPIQFPEKNYTKELIDLVSKMLTYDPNNRISWDNLFNHTWLIKKILVNMTEQSMLRPDIILDDNLLFGSQTSTRSDSEINDSYKENMISDDQIENEYDNTFYLKSRPIAINKKKNTLDLNDSGYNNSSYSLPKTDSLKIQIADKHININEDHFGESCIQLLDNRNSTFPPGNKTVISNNNNNQDSEIHVSYPWDFIKKSLNFFSL